jgi:hypothetical protein
MIVLDASAAVDWLLQTSAGQSIEKRICTRKEALHAPHLLDLEVTQVLRRLTLQGGSPQIVLTRPSTICWISPVRDPGQLVELLHRCPGEPHFAWPSVNCPASCDLDSRLVPIQSSQLPRSPGAGYSLHSSSRMGANEAAGIAE